MAQPVRGARTIRRAVVTGGAGFLGSHLCERLLDRRTVDWFAAQLPAREARAS